MFSSFGKSLYIWTHTKTTYIYVYIYILKRIEHFFLNFKISATSSLQHLKPCWSYIWHLIVILKIVNIKYRLKMSCFNLLNMKKGRNTQSHISIKLYFILGLISLFMI